MQVMAYDGTELEERQCNEVAELSGWSGRRAVLWVNVEGLADIELIRRLGEHFGLHRLALEDVVNVHQRPKVEEYGDHIFIVTRMLPAEQEEGEGPVTEQISLFLGDGFLLTFQERAGDPFNMVRERLRGHRGQIRGAKADYLTYALLDAVIDNYFPMLERYGEKLEQLEDAVMEQADHRQTARIHAMKRDLLALRRSIWPQREMINSLVRDSSPLINEQTRIYLRDCYDHTIQLMDLVETYREIASGLVDVHLSSISTRMNEIMKVLTIIATIFIPLGFIASLYGMNFDTRVSPWNMPELEWVFGYPYALGLMAAVAFGLLYYFWRKGWLGGGPKD
jgi:magnesium transporter